MRKRGHYGARRRQSNRRCRCLALARRTPAAGGNNNTNGADNTDVPATSELVRIVAEAGAHAYLIEMLGITDDQQHLESIA